MTSTDRPLQIRPLRATKTVNGFELPLLAEVIQAILPHRGSFALVDRVDDVNPGKSARGRRLIPRNDPILEDHFPGRPIVPGVLLLEAMGQLAGIVLWSSPGPTGPSDSPTLGDPGSAPMIGVLAGIKKFRFHRLVVPGDVVEMEATCTARVGSLSEFHVTANVDRDLVADGHLQIGFRA